MKNETFDSLGLKTTKSRELIYQRLGEFDHPITAEELFFSLKDEKINLSTIYRTLNSFEKAGIVRKEINETKENVFSLHKEDSHILVCTSCHKRVRLEGCPYHEVNESIEKETGFHLQDQNTEIYGICPDCQKKK